MPPSLILFEDQTMAVLVYCSQTDIETVFSYHGVLFAVDDDRNATIDASNDDARVEADYIANCVKRATVRINQYVAQLYDLTTLPSNEWTKWCCAVFSALYLARRRGARAPESLEQEADEYLEFLKEVKNGDSLIPKNTNESSDAVLLVSNAGMTMSNLNVDQRFAVAKVRVVAKTSSGDQVSELPRRPDYRAIRFME